MAMPTDEDPKREKSNRGKRRNKSSLKNVVSPTEENSARTKFNEEEKINERPNANKPFRKTHVKSFRNTNSNFISKGAKVPKMYKEAARILQDIDEKKASVKNLVYNVRRDVRKIYAIVLQSLKYKNIILRLTNKSKLFRKEKHLNPYLARVLIYDMMFGRKSLTGDSRPIQTVLKHRGDISKALKRIMAQASVKNAEELLDKESILVQTIPRYARVNTLLTTTENVIKELEDQSYKQLQYEEGIALDEFYNLIKNLEKGQFIQDFHFSDLLVFSHRENLSQTELYKNGHIVIEDKTSYLAAKVLEPPEGSTVFDGCAAPGIKTAHLAALMNNKGKIFACDINESRMEILKDMIEHSGVKCSTTILNDFTCIKPNDEQYSYTEYILLDPSCSGSGMVSRLDCLTDDKDSKSYERIKKLSEFQVALLKHALLFKNLKRLVYSTCSVTVEENEEVVKEALSDWEETYKVVDAFPDWPTRGKQEYEFGPLCLRAYPTVDYTNGFFIAMIERIEGSKRTKKKKAKNTTSVNSENVPQDNELSHSQEIEINEKKVHEERTRDDSSKKSKKKKAKDTISVSSENVPQDNESSHLQETEINEKKALEERTTDGPSKKSKKNKKAKDTVSVNSENVSQDNESSHSQEIEINEKKAHEERTTNDSSKKSKKEKLKSKASAALVSTAESKECKDSESTKKRKKSKSNANVDNEKSEPSVLQKVDAVQTNISHSPQKRKINETEHEVYHENSTKDFAKKHKKNRKKVDD